MQHKIPSLKLLYRQLGIYISGLLVIALLLGEAAIVANSLLKIRAPAAQTQRLADTDVNPYGANLFLEREVEAWKRDRTLKMAAEAGLGWVKVHFPWEEIEPARKGDFFDPATHSSSWAKFDQIVAECEIYGLNIIARLDRPPRWSRADNSLAEAPPDRYQDYGDFVTAFVERYRGKIHYIQVWNEPNVYPEWGNQAVDPAQYVELLKVAYISAKAVDPLIKVLCAPLAYTLGQPHPDEGKWISMSDLTYLEGMYAAGAADYFDIFSANAFGFDKPPEAPPDPAVLNFQRVVLQHQIMAKHGDTEKAIWFLEFGWNAAPDTFAAEQLIWQRVSETEQAAYTVRAVEMARRDWPWAGVFMIWYLRQVGNIPADRADYYFRMVDTDFTPRPLYTAVQRAAVNKPSAGPGTYQESHPQVQTAGNWEAVVDTSTSANAYAFTLDPNANLTFKFQGSHLEILTRRGPLDGELQVWVDDNPVPGLPQRDGISVLNLAADEASFSWVTLWRSTDSGVHTLRLSLAAPLNPTGNPTNLVLDALRVSNDPPQFPWLPVGLIGAALVTAVGVLLVLLRRSRASRV